MIPASLQSSIETKTGSLYLGAEPKVLFAFMLNSLTRTMRIKTAIFLAVLYAFTVLAPHAAMAFGQGGYTHCLTDQAAAHDHGNNAGAPHTHEDGAAHAHDQGKSSDSDDKGPAAACCGLFSASAMLTETRSVLPGPATMSTIQPLLPDLVEGQGPSRINRPPIA